VSARVNWVFFWFLRVIFRGSRAFLLGNSVGCVENTGTRHGAKVAVANERAGEASRGSL